MNTYATLYKKTSTGAIQEWQVRVDEINGIATIINYYGQVGGKIQESQEQVLEGKNTGKTNATTAREQAELQAQSRWVKQLKKGYVQNIEDAQAGKIDDVIEGGIAPMLAHKLVSRDIRLNTLHWHSQNSMDTGVSMWKMMAKPIYGQEPVNQSIVLHILLMLFLIMLLAKYLMVNFTTTTIIIILRNFQVLFVRKNQNLDMKIFNITYMIFQIIP